MYYSDSFGPTFIKALELLRKSLSALLFLTASLLYTLSAQSFTLNDIAFLDNNGNGILDMEDTGLIGVEVELISEDSIYASTTTNGDGEYFFNNVELGNYHLRFIYNVQGFELTIYGADPNGIDSDVNNQFGEGTTSIFNVINNLNPGSAGFVECEPMSCKGGINLSLSSQCNAVLLPSMLLSYQPYDNAAYELKIIAADGTLHQGNTFYSSDIGIAYDVQIMDTLCGNSCWTKVNVEYKQQPVIECINDTIPCSAAYSEAALPDVSSNCAEVEIYLIDEAFDAATCDSLYTGMLTRAYVAVDNYGNVSDTCVQKISLLRTPFDSIVGPSNFVINEGTALKCNDELELNEDGYPDPSVTGAPILNYNGMSTDLIPYESGTICNGYATYSDKPFINSNNCITKILRRFTVGEWHCDTLVKREFSQLIEIVDFEGPTIIGLHDVTLSTNGHACEATASLPVPMLYDSCSNDPLTLSLTLPDQFIPEYNGEVVTLPGGSYYIYYTAYDNCGNSTRDSIHAYINDNTGPTVICNDQVGISLSIDSINYLNAEIFDNGSYDECGEVEFEVARMDDPNFEDGTAFGPKVGFTCSDLGQEVMVVLKVTDDEMNNNMCMVSVPVNDKIPAQMICPADITVECNYAFDPDNLSAFFGTPEIYDNCPEANILEQSLSGELNNCGSGILVRHIDLYSANEELIDQCQQIITFEDSTPLTYDRIQAPVAEVLVTGCGVESISPELLGMPEVDEEVCQLIGISVENDTFPFTLEGACLKIIRTFKVVDWCTIDGPGSVYNPFVFEQIIKINNTENPVIALGFDPDSTFCSYSVNCDGLEIMDFLNASATDDCTSNSEIVKRYEVRNTAGDLVRTGSGLDANGYYDLGDYSIRFYAEDKCGNQTIEESTFSVRNCKSPVPYCLQGLSTSIAQMDTNEDGIADADIVMITPDFFDAGSYHPCGADVSLSFSADVNDTLRIFDCQDVVEVVEIEIWVTDDMGNSDFCRTTLDVQDNNDLCTQFICVPNEYTGLAVVTCNGEGSETVGKIYDVRNNSTAPLGTNWGTSEVELIELPTANWTYDAIGPVFGIASDNQGNIYLAASDVYDNPFKVTPNTMGTIYKASPPQYEAEVFVQLPNTGDRTNGIGNIIYDPFNDQIFASNLEDGKIYRISIEGEILDSYDPFMDDDGEEGIVEQNEQVWGIGINKQGENVRLYFPRITPNTRDMYAINIVDGDFPEVNTEFSVIPDLPGIVPRITDLDFSKDGQALIWTERGLGLTDTLVFDQPALDRGQNYLTAHTALTANYEFNGMGWDLITKEDGSKNYYIGGNARINGLNSAGGVSFGYKEEDENPLANCDSLIWVTGNLLNTFLVGNSLALGSELVYGLQGLNYTGNQSGEIPGGNLDSDLYIDFDDILLNTLPKSQIGDVEIMNCAEVIETKINSIEGKISLQDGLGMEGVDIVLQNNENTTTIETDEWGRYEFSDLMENAKYKLTPYYNKNVLDGVNTLDLVMIQRHILELENLKDKNNVAADINKDGKVSAADLLALRKVLLGIEDEFQNNTSWRFLNSDVEFSEFNLNELIESKSFDLVDGIEFANFEAIKIGDVDYSNSALRGYKIEQRSEDRLIITADDVKMKAGEVQIIEFKSSEVIDLRGLQLSLDFNSLEILNMEPGAMEVDEYQYVIFDNMLNLISTPTEINTIGNEEVLFKIHVKAEKDGTLSEFIKIKDGRIAAEAYLNEELNINVIDLSWNDGNENSFSPKIYATPNPFSDVVNLYCEFDREEFITIRIFDMNGNLVLEEESLVNSGSQTYRFDTNDLRLPGIYVCNVILSSSTLTTKILKLEQ